MQEPTNFIEKYLDFFAHTEPPTIFNRWSCIAGIAANLGRQCWIQHGHSKIYPNQFIMLVGESGTRKSTAMKTFMRPLIEIAGYKYIAANKTSKEKFLLDFEEGMDKIKDLDEKLDVTKIGKNKWGKEQSQTMKEIFGVRDASEISECLILSDDFNVFLGHSNIEFIETLTDLWDFDGIYSSRIKTGKSVLVPNPVLNILCGNTQVGIAMAFPPEVIGQGFFSRLICVYSEPSGRRITFPPPPDQQKKAELVGFFERIRNTYKGPINIEPFALTALDDIYQNWKDLDDVRFKSYSTRRFTHLLKLCLCCAAAKDERIINIRTVEYANTILHYTESFMPKALGEFGKARHSDVSAKILEILSKAEKPIQPIEELWPQVHRDLDSVGEFSRLLEGMKQAGKIQVVNGGLLPFRKEQTFDFPHCKIALLREYLEEKEKKGEPI